METLSRKQTTHDHGCLWFRKSSYTLMLKTTLKKQIRRTMAPHRRRTAVVFWAFSAGIVFTLFQPRDTSHLSSGLASETRNRPAGRPFAHLRRCMRAMCVHGGSDGSPSRSAESTDARDETKFSAKSGAKSNRAGMPRVICASGASHVRVGVHIYIYIYIYIHTYIVRRRDHFFTLQE